MFIESWETSKENRRRNETAEEKSSIEEKYAGNNDFGQYEQFAERNSSQYYFYSWDMAYKTFLDVLQNENMEHRQIFLPTAELVSSDEAIKELASISISFGNIFEQLVAVIISGGKYETKIPNTWKYKIKTAISDVQIAVERTFLPRTIVTYYQNHNDLFNNTATKKYLAERENAKLLPFSQKALEAIASAKDVSEEVKILFEKMYLIMEAVKKGIFYGFWGMVNEVHNDDLLAFEGLDGSPLHEISISHKNNNSSFWGKGWLYKIQLENRQVYFLAHEKQIQMGNEVDEKTTISGIVYPADDRGLFEKTF